MVIDEENFFVAVCQKWARYLRDGAVPQLMQATILQPSCPWLTTKALRSVWSLKTEYREYISNAHWDLWQPTSNFGRVPWDFPLLTIIGNLFNCWNGISSSVLWEKEKLGVTEHPAYQWKIKVLSEGTPNWQGGKRIFSCFPPFPGT